MAWAQPSVNGVHALAPTFLLRGHQAAGGVVLSNEVAKRLRWGDDVPPLLGLTACESYPAAHEFAAVHLGVS